MPLADAASYPLWVNAAVFLVAAAIVWAAGTRLAHYVGRIADVTGIEQAFAGMFMLGIITSLPEIANVLTASYSRNPALAVNNLLGSASINILLLAIADAALHKGGLTSFVSRPSMLLQAALGMLVLTFVAIAVISGDVLIFGVGAWSLGLFAASVAAFWLSAGYGRRAPWTVREEPQPQQERRPPQDEHSSLRPLVVKTALAGGVILVAGFALSQTGDALAEQTGLGSGMVGFLLIGVATSLPELSTIVSAVRARKYEMAIGDVFGTNFVNISLIFLADATFVGGAVIDELGRFEVISSLLGVTLTGAYLVGLLERRDPSVLRMGYDSLAVLLLFAGGLALLFSVR